MLARATGKNRRFPHAVLCKTRDQDRGNGEEEKRRKRRRGERREEEKRFLCVLGTPRRPEHTKPMSRSQTLSFPALQRWRAVKRISACFHWLYKTQQDPCRNVLPSIAWALLTINFLFSNYKKPADVLL